MIKKFLTTLLILLVLLTPLVNLYAEDNNKSTFINYEVKANIKFYIDGVLDESKTTNISVGNKLADPGHEYRDDYIFSNWCIDKDCTTKYDFNNVIEDHMSLYGKYTYISEGDYIVEEKPDSDYEIDDITLDVKDIPLTKGDIERIESGEKLHYRLVFKNIDNHDDIDTETKEAIDTKVSSNKQLLYNYVDIYLVKWFEADDYVTRIDALADDATMNISIILPKDVLKSNRTYSLYSKDDNIKVSLLDNKLSFKLNKFGTHGLAYKDKYNPEPFTPTKTGIDTLTGYCNNSNIKYALFILLLTAIFVAYLKNKKGDK